MRQQLFFGTPCLASLSTFSMPRNSALATLAAAAAVWYFTPENRVKAYAEKKAASVASVATATAGSAQRACCNEGLTKKAPTNFQRDYLAALSGGP